MDPFVAEIRIFPFNFAPRGWSFCNGQLLPISQNTALFSLLGTTFGGNGTTNFGLPNLQGSAPMFYGQGPGLSLYDLGQQGGSETVTLLQSQMPSHSHQLKNTPEDGDLTNPAGASIAKASSAVYSTAAVNTTMLPTALSNAGGGLPHNNMMPYLTYNFNIAMQGVYPPR
jgi:microcystin-dependent protein